MEKITGGVYVLREGPHLASKSLASFCVHAYPKSGRR